MDIALREQNPPRYREEVGKLLGQYAYSLGYMEMDNQLRPQHQGLRLDEGQADNNQPLMADRPPCDDDRVPHVGNSRNHAGRGQNVLFVDGQVRFLTGRGIGSDDDIYLNHNRQLGAGVKRSDTVLGPSWTGPVTPGN